MSMSLKRTIFREISRDKTWNPGSLFVRCATLCIFERDAKPSGDLHRMVTVKVGQFEESLELGDAELRVPVALRPHMEVDEGNFESPARLVCMITQC